MGCERGVSEGQMRDDDVCCRTEVRDGEDAFTGVVTKGHERSNWSPSCCRLCSTLANFLPAEYAAELQLTDASQA